MSKNSAKWIQCGKLQLTVCFDCIILVRGKKMDPRKVPKRYAKKGNEGSSYGGVMV
jgi:hypothetical protein